MGEAESREIDQDGTGTPNRRLTRRSALLQAGRGGIVATGLAVLAPGSAAPTMAAQTSTCTCSQPGTDAMAACGCGPAEPIVPSATRATLPADPKQPGRLRQLTDYDRGLWLDTGQQWVSVRGHVFDVRAFGAAGDGATDDWPAFSAAIEAMTSWLGGNSTSAEGATLFVPPGAYRLAQSLLVNRAIRLTGTGAGGRLAAAVLRFDAGLTGIVIEAAQPGLTGSPGRRGDGTIVERLRIEAAPTSVGQPPTTEGGGSAPNYGVWLRSRAVIVDCAVAGFGGDGIRVEAPDSGDPATMAEWLVDGCEVAACGGHGLGVARAASGVCVRLLAEGNAKWGIADDSRLGNAYLQCRAVNNRGGAFTSTDDTNRSLFLGCASASGQPASSFAAATIVVGGDHGAGFAGGNAWTAAGARMLLQALPPASGHAGSASAPTLALRGVPGQTQAHLLVDDAGGARLAELDVAGRLFLGPASAPATGEGGPAPLLVNLIGSTSGQAGIRWDVAGKSGGFVGQLQAFLDPGGADAPAGGAALRFQTAGPNGQAIDTLAMQAGRVGIGTPTPAPNAILDLASTTQSFLPPRMTTTQRDAIPAPLEGATIYNLTTHRLNVHDGTAWRELAFAPTGG